MSPVCMLLYFLLPCFSMFPRDCVRPLTDVIWKRKNHDRHGFFLPLKRRGSHFNRVNVDPFHPMGSDDEDEAGQAFDVPEQAASHRERPWLCEELIQNVAAMPDPLPPWAQKIWMDFLHHVQEEQDALKFSSTSAATTSPPAVKVVDESTQEVKVT